MTSPRLAYARLTQADLDGFHRLVVDEHVRRFLMDGTIYPRDWSAARIAESDDLFARRGVGLWLVRAAATAEVVGFCGFMDLPDVHPEPQLVYALFEGWTGQGYATEMARAAIAAARAQPGFEAIVANVDAPNVASLRVLEKLGFERIATRAGAFVDVVVLRLGSAREAR